MALTNWNDILNKPKGIDEVPEIALTVEQLSASVLSIGEDVGEIAENVQEIALEISQLSASTLPYGPEETIKEAIDNVSDWGEAEELLSDTGLKVYGYKNAALKLAFLKIVGTVNTPTAATYDQAINEKYRPITDSEVFNIIRYNGNIAVRGDNTHLVLNVDNTKNWQTGTLMYPTRN